MFDGILGTPSVIMIAELGINALSPFLAVNITFLMYFNASGGLLTDLGMGFYRFDGQRHLY